MYNINQNAKIQRFTTLNSHCFVHVLKPWEAGISDRNALFSLTRFLLLFWTVRSEAMMNSKKCCSETLVVSFTHKRLATQFHIVASDTAH